MKQYLFTLFIILIFCYTTTAQTKLTATAIINNSIKAMGEGWGTVTTLRLEGYGNTFIVDQSERSEGPYLPSQEFKTTIRHLLSNTMQIDVRSILYTFTSSGKYLIDEMAIAAKGRTRLRAIPADDNLQDDIFATPEVVLQKAKLSGNSIYEKDTLLQQVQHYIIKFFYQQHPIRVFINQETNLLTAVETFKPYQSGFAQVFGDAKKTIFYSFWCLLSDNVHYPLQRDTYYNGWYLGSYIVNKWAVNPPVLVDTLRIPDSIKTKAGFLLTDIDNNNRKNLDDEAKQIVEGI